jgi:catechol 2,3-dioxygenase-like lactoylglutathione lyase family enzyme
MGFYERAFGAQMESRDRHTERDFSRWTQVQGGAERTLLKFGDATLELLEFDYPGGSYPQDLSPYDTRFQHFGIVVPDMQRAMERLNAIAGWTAISTEGPQTLPPSAGGVTAFKFRDPDGHPLELLQFPVGESPRHWELDTSAGIFSGIDHSALSIRNIDRSLDFYHSLGLHVSARTLNQGIEQQRLDGVRSPQVDVVALAPPIPTPHVELLHYRTSSRPPPENLAINDTAAARLILSSSDGEAQYVRGELIRDPDGHFLEVLE